MTIIDCDGSAVPTSLPLTYDLSKGLTVVVVDAAAPLSGTACESTVQAILVWHPRRRPEKVHEKTLVFDIEILLP